MVYRKIEIMCTEIGDLIMEDMNLVETVDLMLSEDYKNRFKAEHLQLLIRLNKLSEMLDKWVRGELDFEPTCEREVLEKQEQAMIDYISTLEYRAKQEGIELEAYFCGKPVF